MFLLKIILLNKIQVCQDLLMLGKNLIVLKIAMLDSNKTKDSVATVIRAAAR